MSGRLGGPDLRPAVALVAARGHTPDFLTPPPTSPTGDIAADLDRFHDDTIQLRGRGLLLVPTAFQWAGPVTGTRAPWQPTVMYPARGIATLWEEGRAATPAGLRALLGRTRAAAGRSGRAALDHRAGPPSRDLTRRCVPAPQRAARRGPVTGRRAGRSVLYARTRLGDALAGRETG